ncbi:MAG: endolytic transglycosylase MltG [Actinomycetes bacterium]
MTSAGAAGRPPTGSRRRRLAATVVVLVLVVGGVAVLVRKVMTPTDYPGPGHGEVVVVVQPGDSATAIGATLAKADVVASSSAFVDAAAADDRSLGIQPGSYSMAQQMSGQGALERLLDPSARVLVQVTVPEGLRLSQTVDRLVVASGLPVTDFERALRQPQRLGLPPYANGDAEGFLFPATYSFDPGVSAMTMLQAMVQRFDQAARETRLVTGSQAVGMTPREVVTVASLVQAEVAEPDFGKAARVVANRLNVGMPLQFDSTVNYALGSDDLTLNNDQLGVDSPYNTYANAGLPPGPINSPGQAALEAALHPPAGDWMYFVAVAPGSPDTRFTSSYDQFLAWKNQFYSAVP